MKIGSSLDNLFTRLTQTERKKSKDITSDYKPAFPPSKQATLVAQLTEVFSKLNLDSEEGLKKARQELIQKVIAIKFGNALVTDTQFVIMVNAIEEEVSGNENLESEFNQAIREIVAQG
jgi:hypothetical protein